MIGGSVVAGCGGGNGATVNTDRLTVVSGAASAVGAGMILPSGDGERGSDA